MQKEINKLKKLGMSSLQAMVFVRDIARKWYAIGDINGMTYNYEENPKESFDTKFSKKLAKNKDQIIVFTNAATLEIGEGPKLLVN